MARRDDRREDDDPPLAAPPPGPAPAPPSRRYDSSLTTLRVSHAEIMRLLAEREAIPTPRTPRGLTPAVEEEVAVDESRWDTLEPVSGPELAPEVPVRPSAVAMEAYFAENNFEAAMVMAEALLERDPTHAAARECLERCDFMLVSSYTTDLVQTHRVPRRTAAPPPGLPPFKPHVQAVLALVDGKRTTAEILAESGLGKLEGLRALAELALLHVIDLF